MRSPANTATGSATDHHAGKWFLWDGASWRREETKLAYRWAHQKAKTLAAGTDNATSPSSAPDRRPSPAGVERLAQSDRAFAVTSEIWDADPWLLGTPGGTVDLRTGEIRAAVREDYITKTAAVAPADTPDCPLWLKFLNQACDADAGLIRFLQQWNGYSLTGSIQEHALLFVHGPGGNGKGVWLNTVSNIMGDYCRTAAMDTFTASKHDRHTTELAALKGARMVCASETEEGRAWSEVRIKQLTGGDRIAARFMRQDFFEFSPQFKLTVIGNHVPELHNVDDAARRRFNLAPFTHKPPVVDKELEEKLRAEWPAILRWMIEGCLDWQKNGLVRPAAVTTSTADYFSDQDLLAQWIEECCEQWHHQSSTPSLACSHPGGTTPRAVARSREQQGVLNGPAVAGVHADQGESVCAGAASEASGSTPTTIMTPMAKPSVSDCRFRRISPINAYTRARMGAIRKKATNPTIRHKPSRSAFVCWRYCGRQFI